MKFHSPSRHEAPPSSRLVGVICPSRKGRLRVDSNTRSKVSIFARQIACQSHVSNNETVVHWFSSSAPQPSGQILPFQLTTHALVTEVRQDRGQQPMAGYGP